MIARRTISRSLHIGLLRPCHGLNRTKFTIPVVESSSSNALQRSSPQRQQWSSSSSYSTTHPSSSTTKDNHGDDTGSRTLKDSILDTAVDQYVMGMGWTTEALVAAAHDHGIASTMNHAVMFPRGAVEMVERFCMRCNREMSVKMMGMETSSMKGHEVVKQCMRMRLEMLIPFVQSGRWTEAMALAAFGSSVRDVVPLSSLLENSGNTVYQLAILADEICFLAGSRDTDFDWYTKRAGVGTIFAAAQFYMITDNSVGFSETWRFLSDRIDEAATAHGALDSVLSSVSFFASTLVK